MARDFYPFVEKDPSTSDSSQSDSRANGSVKNTPETPMEVHNPARIAVYDDAAAAPRVVMVEPKDVRSFLEEITATVNHLSHEQGGSIPFMVIREIVENFIHAYFQAPTITILDGGNTIRFSDQGPGIKQKDLALEYGTSSATEEMKHYIRGVGSGLPYAQQYMVDKGGSLDIEDNLGGGTVVTISTRPAHDAAALTRPDEQTEATAGSAPMSQQPMGYMPQQAQPWQQGGYGMPAQPAMPQQPAMPAQQGWPQYGQMPYQQQWAQPQQQPYGQPWQQQMPPQTQPQMPMQQMPPAQPAAPMPPQMPQLDERGQSILAYFSAHELGGPTDLTNAFGGSSATWSRALQALAAQGIVIKDSQKYRLTGYGQTLLG